MEDRAGEAFGTESVWDYPRPPRLERTEKLLRVVHAGVVVAETRRGWRVLETSHPPVYYFPEADVRMGLLRPSARGGSFCEFKGVARYWNLDLTGAFRVSDGGAEEVGEVAVVPGVGWSYPAPSRAFAALKDAVAFYASKVDECWVEDEQVQAQPGDFYGGWITSWVKGPFKGGAGTMGW